MSNELDALQVSRAADLPMKKHQLTVAVDLTILVDKIIHIKRDELTPVSKIALSLIK